MLPHPSGVSHFEKGRSSILHNWKFFYFDIDWPDCTGSFLLLEEVSAFTERVRNDENGRSSIVLGFVKRIVQILLYEDFYSNEAAK